MSTVDDKPQEISEDSAGEITASTAAGGHLPEQETASPAPIILFFLIGLIASLVVGWVVFPKLLYSQKKQPFNFNHALHTEEVGDCDSCHYFYEDGRFSGIPKLDSCVECHEEVMGETEDEAIFVEEYVLQNREVPWLVYSKQPPCVFFSHAAHVEMGGMDCVTCHGHIGESTTSRIYEENRWTGYSRDIWGKNIAGLKKHTWDRMKMDDCAECHKRENVNQGSVQTQRGGCFVCHH